MKTVRYLRGGDGFSLIEMLLAMTILVVIVLIMSTVFHQSSLAWDAGTRKARGNTTARAVLGFMQREMLGAVADGDSMTCYMDHGADELSFWTLEADGTRKHIKYALEPDTSGDYLVRIASGTNSGTMMTNVTHFSVVTPDEEQYALRLPTWVGIRMAIRRSAEVSGVGAWSYGPNHEDNTGEEDSDDIGTW